MVTSTDQLGRTFSKFFEEAEPILRRALVASCGPEIGREATADAFEYAWRNWARIGSMDHPVGYLFRVGRSAAKKYRRSQVRVGEPRSAAATPWVEPQLTAGLGDLTHRQRTAVVLRHSYGYTHREIAQVMGVSISSVQRHVERGLGKLRRRLDVTP